VKTQIDRGLFLVVIFLLGLGLVQVYSSSFIFATESFDDGLLFVKKQGIFVAASVLLMVCLTYMPWRWLERFAVAVWAGAFLGIILTLIPGIGHRIGGAARWLSVGGGFRLEPSEFLKYSTPVVLSFMFTNEKFREPRLRNLLRWAAVFTPLVLLLRQPDFGSFAIITLVSFSILFVCGLKWRYVVGGIATVVAAFYFLIVRESYRMARVTSFLDPWADPAKKGFQVIQSMLGFHSGGVTGVGLGQGQGKLFFLPEAHTDFTMSVLGEELGFIGICLVLLIFGYVVLRGLQISAKTTDDRQKIITLGVTLTLAITIFINAGVAMGLLPTKGLGMPFLSYGGSHLLAACFGLSMILNIDKQSRTTSAKSFIKIKR
jgi:cell division protein FtsW